MGGGLERGSVWTENCRKTQSFSSSSDWLIGLFSFKTLSLYEEHLYPFPFGIRQMSGENSRVCFTDQFHLNTCTFHPRTVLSPVCLLPRQPGDGGCPEQPGDGAVPTRSIKPQNSTADHYGNCPRTQLTVLYLHPTATPRSGHTISPCTDETEVRG